MIVIAPALLKRIADAAEAAWPAECCGLLVGRGTWRRLEVHKVVEAPNLLAGTPDRFELDPRVRLAVEKECRATPMRIVGHYHSHPDGSAVPSATDAARAWEPDLAWLVAGIADGQAVQILAYRFDEPSGRFRPLGMRTPKKCAWQESPCIPPASSP